MRKCLPNVFFHFSASSPVLLGVLNRITKLSYRPANDRMPLPVLKDIDKQEKIKALREASKRVCLNADTLPSVCFYSILNAVHSVTW